jgi:hypothetical protein
MQKFNRQTKEDGQDPSATWGEDRTESDTEDPDPELAASTGAGPHPGKTPTRDPLLDWSDDDATEIHDPTPLAFTFPLNPPLADTEEEVLEVAPLATRGGGKKRAATGPSRGEKRAATGPSRGDKRRKVSGVKPRPMASGYALLPAYYI